MAEKVITHGFGVPNDALPHQFLVRIPVGRTDPVEVWEDFGAAGVGTGQGDGGRQALRHLFGERGAGDHGQRHATAQQLAGHFVQEAPGARFEALGGPGHAAAIGAQRRQAADGFGEGVAGGDHQQHRGGAHGGLEIGGGAQAGRQRHARQVAGVLVAGVDALDLGRVAAPDQGVVALPRHLRGEGGAPGAGAQHGDGGRRDHAGVLMERGGAPPGTAAGRSIRWRIRRCRRPATWPTSAARRGGAGSRRRSPRN